MCNFIPEDIGTPGSTQGLTLGPNGNLFVGTNRSSVLEYNGTTGAFVRTFVPSGSAGLGASSPFGFVFGPNGNLFAGSTNGTVLEYNGTTGAFVTSLIPAGVGGLQSPFGLVFGPTATDGGGNGGGTTPPPSAVPEPSTWAAAWVGVGVVNRAQVSKSNGSVYRVISGLYTRRMVV